MRDIYIFRPVVSEQLFDESEQIPFKAKCCRGVIVWTLGNSFLHDQSRYSQIHGQHLEELTLSCLYFSPALLSNSYNCFSEISFERGHILWEKKEKWEGEKMFILSLSLLPFEAFPANAFHSTGTSVTVYNCPLTWFYQSYSKDAHHLGLQE